MNEKTIQCLPNPSQHLPIYVQQFPSYSNRKCKTSPFSRTTAHIFVSSRDAPAIITQYVPWIERQFNACQTHRSMYLSICDNYEGRNVMIWLLLWTSMFKNPKFPKEIYILSETSKWHKKEILTINTKSTICRNWAISLKLRKIIQTLNNIPSQILLQRTN